MDSPKNKQPFISICIPAYKRIDFLERLFSSISNQTFKDFEVIVSDDSPGEEVKNLCEQYKELFLIKYHRNAVALGTPENWNESIRRASGKWIKIMHDDDWFFSATALQGFVSAIAQHPSLNFFFSAYQNVLDGNNIETARPADWRLKKLSKNPATLISSNIIGPPSATIYLNQPGFCYDKKLKWLVDIDFYIRYLRKNPPFFIHDKLINVGIHGEQVTKSSFRIASVEIPEHIYLLKKIGVDNMQNIWVFDAIWRLIRNLKITSGTQIKDAGYVEDIPFIILSIIRFQKKIPSGLLSFGPFSKMLMMACYWRCKKDMSSAQ